MRMPFNYNMNLRYAQALNMRAFSTKESAVEDEISKSIKDAEDFFVPIKKGEKDVTTAGGEKTLSRVENLQLKGIRPVNDEEVKDDLQVELEEEKLPMQVRERRQTVQVYEVFKEKAQWGEFYRVYGLCLLLLGGYFLTVPFYNVVCQTFGFTMSQHAKDYRTPPEQVNVFRKWRVAFMSHAEDEIPWEFSPETEQVLVNAGETALAFYKVYNRSDKPIAGIAIYQIFPEECALYFNKIQCFCFENQLLYPNESLELPVLFYLDPSINHDPNLGDEKQITLTYHFYPSADQSVAYVLQEEIEKH